MKQLAVITGILILLAASSLLLWANPAAFIAGIPPASVTSINDSAEAPYVSFSETGHFYSTGIEVEIYTSVSDAEIYYTTDGSEPATDGKKYNAPIKINAGAKTSATVLKAIAVAGDKTSKTAVHTYFTGSDVDTRFDMLVFSLSTDNENLYDYDNGILVEGRLRDEYIAKNPTKEIIPPDPANFNLRGREGERTVYVETFTADGERVAAQYAGMRVHGGWSRAASQKSLRLIARSEYGAANFEYDFFSGDTAPYDTPITAYDTIVLRNGANDREFGMLRNEVASLMASEAGFKAVSPSRPAAVFLNGKYYGFTWVQVSINEQYLQDVYNAPDQSFEIVTSETDGILQYFQEDLGDDVNFAAVEAVVDIDNLLWYYAYEIYLGNNDWPHNNLKRWRYTGEQQAGMAPELDGRWRYMMYDLDWVLGLYGMAANTDDIKQVLGGQRNSRILSALMKRPELAEKFAVIICDIAANVVTVPNVLKAINSFYGEAENEISTALAANKYPSWVSEYSVETNHANMINCAATRSKYIFTSLSKFLGCKNKMYNVKVTGGEAVIGTVKAISSRYLTDLSVPVTPALPRYTAFDHWVLNGEKIYEPDIKVSAADAISGTVELELVTRDDTPEIIFNSVYAEQGGRNGCELLNTTGHTVVLQNLYISDTPDNLSRWKLPDVRLPSGASISLSGQNGANAQDLLKLRMNFNIQSGEVLYLSDESGNILDYISVDRAIN